MSRWEKYRKFVDDSHNSVANEWNVKDSSEVKLSIKSMLFVIALPFAFWAVIIGLAVLAYFWLASHSPSYKSYNSDSPEDLSLDLDLEYHPGIGSSPEGYYDQFGGYYGK